jgi:PAS domain S-box-containing protein
MSRIYHWIVLIVEDDPVQSLLFQKVLSQEGYIVQVAMSGNEALPLIRKLTPPAILLLDYELPDMNARELLRILKKEKNQTPFIIVTGRGDEKIAVELMKLGALDYLVKEKGISRILPAVLKRAVKYLQTEKELRDAQKAITHAEKMFQTLVEKSPIGIFLTQGNRITFANTKFCEISGFSLDELKQRFLFDNGKGILKTDQGNDKNYLKFSKVNAATGIRRPFFELLRKKGDAVSVEIHTAEAVYEDQNYTINSVIDITDTLNGEKMLYDAHRDVIWRLGRAAEFRDNETGMHIIRMSQYCVLLAREAGMSQDKCEKFLNAVMLHDIGKIGIPDHILLKPGRFNEDEKKIMDNHVVIGSRILAGSGQELMEMACIISLYHHENWDGSGYAEGLQGKDIPLEARICAICDVFDALLSHRPYKEAWEFDDAVIEINDQKGKKFDPFLVDCFNRIVPDLKYIREIYSDNTEIKKMSLWM